MSEEQQEYILNKKETKITKIGIKWSYSHYRKIVQAFLFNLKHSIDEGFLEFDSDLEKEREELSHILKNGAYFLYRLNIGNDSNMSWNPASIPFDIYFNEEIEDLVNKEGSGLNGELFILYLKGFLPHEKSYIIEYWS